MRDHHSNATSGCEAAGTTDYRSDPKRFRQSMEDWRGLNGRTAADDARRFRDPDQEGRDPRFGDGVAAHALLLAGAAIAFAVLLRAALEWWI